jgi:hypothetical protein
MYCPKCGAQNIIEARFCRMCGTNLLPQMSASQPLLVQPNYDRAIRKLFTGIAFLLIALISLFSHRMFFWWMLFPAIPMISKGISGLIQARQIQTTMGMAYGYSPKQVPPASYSNYRARQTGELVPPNVTEHTTRLFDNK